MKIKNYILIYLTLITIVSCTGSRWYYKAAEKLEKQGLVSEAADYYLESLHRKPSNLKARVKLKEVGQKHVSSLASEFFRNYNTQQLEPSLITFEKLKAYVAKSLVLGIELNYPKNYDEDYLAAVELYCLNNHSKAALLVYQKKYSEALIYILKINKYNPDYKNTRQLEIIAFCEPIYQSSIIQIENKNYKNALSFLLKINEKTENYKDSKDLLELSKAMQTKGFMLFQPTTSRSNLDLDIKNNLFSSFNQIAIQKFDFVKIINNTPFQNSTNIIDLNNNNNIDLIQAIRKATGADYFYTFDVSNSKEYYSGLTKSEYTGFEQVAVKINTVIVTEYKPFQYYLKKENRSFSYDFTYKLINVNSNQIVSSQTINHIANDAIEFQESKNFTVGNSNKYYPYNPSQTNAPSQLNIYSWRDKFSARKNLKSLEELKIEVFNKTLNLFSSSATKMN